MPTKSTMTAIATENEMCQSLSHPKSNFFKYLHLEIIQSFRSKFDLFLFLLNRRRKVWRYLRLLKRKSKELKRFRNLWMLKMKLSHKYAPCHAVQIHTLVAIVVWCVVVNAPLYLEKKVVRVKVNSIFISF